MFTSSICLFLNGYKIGVFIASSLGVILLLALIGYLFYLYWREARRRKAVLANLKQEKEHLSLALEGGEYIRLEITVWYLPV